MTNDAETTDQVPNQGQDQDQDPAAVVRAFIDAMHAWELSAAASMAAADQAGENGFDPKYGIEDRQNAVFARFCTPKTRPYGRRGSYGNPPEYQPAHEVVLQSTIETPRRAVVETQQGTGFRNRLRYILARRGGRWRLDSVKWQKHDGSWSNGTL